MFHTIILAGHLGRDPELRYTPDGQAVTSFSLAVADGFGDSKKTIWFRVSAWGKLGESCNEYLRKGSKALVEGRLAADKASGGPRTWEDQSGRTRASFEVSATAVRFLSSKNEAGEPAGGSTLDDASDDIPF